MNELIKELAHKADFINKKHNGDEWRWGYIDSELSAKLEKFANLIIQECAEVQMKRSCGRHGYDKYEDSQAIEHHFEIKE